MSDETLSARSRTIFGLVGTGVLAAGTAFVVVSTTASHAGSTYYTADFGRAGQGLDPGKSDVKIRGIAVGGVARIKLDRDGKVTVKLRLDKGVKIPRTTSATIEPVSVFGPKDLSLDLGAGELTGPYLGNGGKISKTKEPAELSDTAWPTYNLAKAINPDEVVAIVHTFGAGLSGEGPALRRTIDNGSTVVNAVHQNRQAIQSLLNDINGLSGTLADRGDTWVRFTGDFNRLSTVVSRRPDKIGQLLDQSAQLADTVGTTLQGHGRNIGKIIDGVGDTAAVVNGQRRNIPVLLDGLNGFFGMLGRIIRTPGPQGTMVAQVVDTLPLDLCQTLIDICPSTPTKTAFDQKTKSQGTPAARKPAGTSAGGRP